MTKLTTYPTRNDILSAVADWGNSNATYVIKNKLRGTYNEIKTSWVLRQLKKLEARGLVERKPTSYVSMISWGVTDAGRAALKGKSDGRTVPLPVR